MDIHWRNKVIKLATCGLVVLMLLGCNSTKRIAENTSKSVNNIENRVEEVIKENPFKIETSQLVLFDSVGKIVPIKLKIEKNGIKGEINLSDTALTYVLEQKDTLIKSRSIKEVKISDSSKETTITLKKNKSFLDRIKQYFNTIITITLIFIIAYLAYKAYKKTSPL